MVGALLAMTIGLQNGMPQQTAVPTERHWAWHDLEYYAFVHFGPNTFTNQEWGSGLEDPKVFAPTNLDTDQWCRVFKDAGMKAVILTAKHHDGFCLWPSKLSTHTVRESGFGRDVLAELSASCKKYGLKMGVYLSPWDRNHPKYGTPEYNDVFVGMLEEVLGGKYGEIFEVWFDGANGEGPNGKRQVYDFARFNQTVRKLQPKAVIFSDAGPDIRWVGNEDGYAGKTNWYTIDRDRYVPGTPLYAELTEGKKGGKDWVPSECDVSIRKGWFWRASEDTTVKTPEKLLDIWLGSVGRGSNLLLNVPPDRRGQISPADEKALMEFKKMREKLFANPLDSINGGFSSGSQNHGWVWTPDESDKSPTWAIRFPNPTECNMVEIREILGGGQAIAGWKVSGLAKDGWHEVTRGTTIGRRRIVQFSKVKVSELKLEITESLGTVSLLMPFTAYFAEP
ncbi:MAG: alpha-L-fucosidase [Fimbriimonadaceae bacterium]|nr:MAG: alpha-L-fucosidase [Fimbriimonadaceae bacterium]